MGLFNTLLFLLGYISLGLMLGTRHAFTVVDSSFFLPGWAEKGKRHSPGGGDENQNKK